MINKINILEVANAADWFALAVDYPQKNQTLLEYGGEVDSWLDNPVELMKRRDAVEYTALFDIGSPEPPFPLMECHYCQDKQARLRRIVTFYRTYGIEHESAYAPDHLCVELAYLGYLARLAHAYPNRDDLVLAVQAFATAHPLGWVTKVADKLHQEFPNSPFTVLFEGLVRFLSEVAGRQMIPFAAVS